MKVGITGYTGRMGKAVTAAIASYPELTLSSGFLRTTNAEKFCRESEIIIDFSTPEVAIRIITEASKTKIPVVSGTTGFSDHEFKIIKDMSKLIPIFHSPNMSFGIALLKSYLKHAAQVLSDFDIEILDAHHRDKKDIPSGTALMLAEAMTGNKDNIVVRAKGNQSKRKPDEIGIASIRGGRIFSDHKVMFLSDDEVIKFSHQSLSNKTYAHGAVKAALWLKSQKPGLYSMDDLLGNYTTGKNSSKL